VPTTSVFGASRDSIEPETSFPVSQTTIQETSTDKISLVENKDVIVSEGSITTTVIPAENFVTTLTPGIEAFPSSSSSSENKELLVSGDEVPITIKPLEPLDESVVSGGDQNEISSSVSNPTTKSPELLPEDYPTTQSWIPDTSLAAEHRETDAKLSATTRNVSNSIDSSQGDVLTTTPLTSSSSSIQDSLVPQVSLAEGVIQMEVTTPLPSTVFDDDEVKLNPVVPHDSSLLNDDVISVV
jgi:hypothetical protein